MDKRIGDTFEFQPKEVWDAERIRREQVIKDAKSSQTFTQPNNTLPQESDVQKALTKMAEKKIISK